MKDSSHIINIRHLNNAERSGVSICYKESVPVRVINFPYFNKVLLSEASHNNKKPIEFLLSKTTMNLPYFYLTLEAYTCHKKS